MKNLLFIFFVAASLLGFLSACEKEEPVLSEEPLCLEGEFRQLNPNCTVYIEGASEGYIYDIRVYGHPEVDSITVTGTTLPERFRIRGTRFYFQIDSTGTYNECNHLFSNDVPYYISNVSTTLCGETTNNF
jgi:hypothetical protein